jgi:DNA polymerase I-like protein with 3'-5' exonuclease and polymerase domains
VILDEIRTAFAEDPGPSALDTETTSIHGLWRDLEIRGISLALGQRTWYLSLTHPHSENLGFSEVRALVADLFGPPRTWCWANAKYDWSVLNSTLGVMAELVPAWDVLVGAWLEDENVLPRDLKGRCSAIFGPDARAPQEHMKRLCAGPTLAELEDEHYYGPAGRVEGGPRQPMGITRTAAHDAALVDPRYGSREMWDLTATEMAPYARQDAALTLDLYRYQRSLDHRHRIGDAMGREMDVARVLLDMERTGIRIDAGRAQAAHAAAVARTEELQILFEGINPRSHPQLTDLLVNQWGFPVLHRSAKTNEPCWDRETLELLGDDPRITGLLEWRRLDKALTSYYRPYLDCLDDNDRIHPTFNAAKVKTGRFSSERPNLQTIPREDTLSEVRAVFIPAPGFELWEYDLAQAEVRVAAAISGEEALLAALRAGEDIYATVASAMGCSRKTAKEVVLANNYGASAIRLAASLLKGTGRMVTPTDVTRADHLQRRLAKAYPRLGRMSDRLADIARRDGRLPLPPKGRYRHFRGSGYAPQPYKDALNSACQGGVGELAKQIMITIHPLLGEHGTRLLLQVHDSFVCEVAPGTGERVGLLFQSVVDDVNYWPVVPMPIEAKVWKPAATNGHRPLASDPGGGSHVGTP